MRDSSRGPSRQPSRTPSRGLPIKYLHNMLAVSQTTIGIQPELALTNAEGYVLRSQAKLQEWSNFIAATAHSIEPTYLTPRQSLLHERQKTPDTDNAASVGYSTNTPALGTAQETLAGLITSKLLFSLQEPDTNIHLLALWKEQPELALQILGRLNCESLNVTRHRTACPYCKFTP